MPTLISRRELITRRLAGIRLLSPRATAAADVVRELGAVQAQDFHGAKWAIAQRARGLTDASIEREFNDGALIRTHVLRPTWHFVAPEDARWMLALTAPRIARTMGHYNDVFELDASVFRRSNDAMAAALAGGKFLTRAELSAAIERAGVPVTSTMKLTRLVMMAELDAVICSGPRRGKQLTYALFDERVASTPPLERDEALLRLIRRYFSTRGPATLHDFAWWSGLTLGDAKRGVQMAGTELTRATCEGVDHWFVDASVRRASASAMLLPNYDEYFIGYKDRGAVGHRVGHSNAVIGGDAGVSHAAFLNGELVGRWKRATQPKGVVVDLTLECRLTAAERARLGAAARRFATFLGIPVNLRTTGDGRRTTGDGRRGTGDGRTTNTTKGRR